MAMLSPNTQGLREKSDYTTTRAKLKPEQNTTGVPDGKGTVVMSLPITNDLEKVMERCVFREIDFTTPEEANHESRQ